MVGERTVLTKISAVLRYADMTPLEFMRNRGERETEAVSIRAGTTLAYFKQIAYQHRRPSIALAKRLAAETGGELDVMQMMLTELKQPRAQRSTASEAA